MDTTFTTDSLRKALTHIETEGGKKVDIRTVRFGDNGPCTELHFSFTVQGKDLCVRLDATGKLTRRVEELIK